MKKSLKVWVKYTNNSFQNILASRVSMIFLLFGKILRVLLFLVFLVFLFKGAKGLGTYTREQVIFFYLSYNLIDALGQFFFREVYRFRGLIVSGDFDLVLVKPINPLIRVLLGGADAMDLIMLFLLSSLTVAFCFQNFSINFWQLILFLVLIINSLILSAAFHIVVLGIGIVTTSVDHLVLIYRDLTSMLRIPVDLYVDPIRFILTFLIPVGMMITFPSKALLGLLSGEFLLIALIFGIGSLFLAMRFWKLCLNKYSSASS